MSKDKYAITEEKFLEQIISLARIYGWKVAHFRPAMTKWGWRTAVSGDGKGFPDCVLVKTGRMIFAELKSDTGKLSPEQVEWLRILGLKMGIEVYIWRPSDFNDIVGILSGVADG